MQKPEHPTYLHFLYIHSIYSFLSKQPFHQILLSTSSDASLPPIKTSIIEDSAGSYYIYSSLMALSRLNLDISSLQTCYSLASTLLLTQHVKPFPSQKVC